MMDYLRVHRRNSFIFVVLEFRLYFFNFVFLSFLELHKVQIERSFTCVCSYLRIDLFNYMIIIFDISLIKKYLHN